MTIDVDKYPFLFSTTTRIAKNIDEDFYNGNHFVWIALKFDDKKQAANSNPLTIANNFIREVATYDGHHDRINANKVGMMNGAMEMYKHKKISKKERKQIMTRIEISTYDEFLPLLYIIDTKKVASRIIEVPPDKAAKPDSPEYKLLDLHENEYELIDLAEIVGAATRIERKRIEKSV